VKTDPNKVTAIMEWPRPIRELRGLLGLTSYYRKFMQNYVLIIKPLTKLFKKNNFQWNPQD